MGFELDDEFFFGQLAGIDCFAPNTYFYSFNDKLEYLCAVC